MELLITCTDFFKNYKNLNETQASLRYTKLTPYHRKSRRKEEDLRAYS